MATGTTVGVFIIPIVFSFIFGGLVLGTALQGERTFSFAGTSSGSMQIVDLQSQYATSDNVGASVSVSDAEFNCGDLYITIYDVSSGQRKAIKQGAFFDQCYGSSGTLPLEERFSVKMESPGQYLLEAQLFDESGDRFITTSQKFNVQ
ncbi:MAG TPA: hypothetical protein VNK44_02530 [Candidatus Nitrosotenuis sp.]|nr:hypothetical protein [Candidatus Nitrosotenuis sp.]